MWQFRILFLPLFVKTSLAFNWQTLGNCGIPVSRPNSSIFDNLQERSGRLGSGPVATTTLAPIRPDGRIVGGQEATAHSWPWQAHLAVCGKWYGNLECNICGGSLIHPKYLASAAHCVPDSASGTIIMGAHAISHGGKQRIPVLKFHVHPSWNEPSMFDHDMSIIELKNPAAITKEVIPICLPHKTTCFGTRTPCVVTGWGLTDENGGFPDKLQEVAVRLMDPSTCKQYVGYKDTVTDNMICAGYESGGKDACAGDSGGPLVCALDGGGWVLYGIVSWGYGCARPSSPGVYSKVSNMLTFVKQVTGLSADPNLARTPESCKEYQKGYEETWKANNINVYATLTPAWMNTQAPKKPITPPPTSVECDYDKTSNGQYYFTNKNDEWGGKITSPNYPKSYPNNLECAWQILNYDANKYIMIQIKSVKMDCRDRLFVRNEKKEYSLCRVRRMVRIKDNNEISLKFVTNGNRGGQGFRLEYKFYSIYFMCDGEENFHVKMSNTRKETNGRLRSEHFPRPYTPNSQCRWMITTEDNVVIGLFLRMFRTEKATGCSNKTDNLIVFDSPSCSNEDLNSASIWGTLCGYKPNNKFKYNTKLRRACIVFVADGDRSRSRGMDIQLKGYPEN